MNAVRFFFVASLPQRVLKHRKIVQCSNWWIIISRTAGDEQQRQNELTKWKGCQWCCRCRWRVAYAKRSSSLSILLILTALGFRLPFTSMTTTSTTSLVFLHHRTFFCCIALLKLVTHSHLMKFSCMHFTSIHFLPYFFGSPSPTISKWEKSGNISLTSLTPTEDSFLTINPAASEFLLILASTHIAVSSIDLNNEMEYSACSRNCNKMPRAQQSRRMQLANEKKVC